MLHLLTRLKQGERGVRIAGDIAGIASGPNMLRQLIALGLSRRLDAAGDQLDLVLSIANRPVASGLANDINQLEERALIPALSDLRDLAVGVEADDVNLPGLAYLSPPMLECPTYNRQGDRSICQEVVIQTWQIRAASGEEFDGGVHLDRQRI